MSVLPLSKGVMPMYSSNKVVNLLIVDDDVRMVEMIQEALKSNDFIEVVAVAHDGLDGLRKLRLTQPDVVLLDLIMPTVDGLGFLERALKEDLLQQTKVIVSSELSQESIVKYALNLGASFYMLKPYSMDVLFDRIRLTAVDFEELTPPQIIPMDVNSHIVKHLIESGLPVHTLGYKYFYLALQHLITERVDVFSITKSIYPYVASIFKTSSANVDKAMRHSLTLAYSQNNSHLADFLKRMNYKDPHKKPSNSEYINLVLEQIKQELSGLN